MAKKHSTRRTRSKQKKLSHGGGRITTRTEAVANTSVTTVTKSTTAVVAQKGPHTEGTVANAAAEVQVHKNIPLPNSEAGDEAGDERNSQRSSAPRKKALKITADQYNDPNHNYLQYWEGRDYENQAEIVAIKRLLKGRHFTHAVDIGGGYGRLCVLLEDYADKVTLAEPSQQQLDIAKEYLKEHPEIDRKLMQVEGLPFADGSVDLFTMIRVMHHLPDPQVPFSEMYRALSSDGYIILEMANYTHFRNRVKHALKGKRLPEEPVDIRSAEHRSKDEIPFVNHNPRTVVKQLAQAGLRVEKVLSVSNLRSPGLKKVVPRGLMVGLEKILQKPLAPSYFGPSIFFLVRKAK